MMDNVGVCDGCDKLELCNSNILINNILQMCRMGEMQMESGGIVSCFNPRHFLFCRITEALITLTAIWDGNTVRVGFFVWLSAWYYENNFITF